MTGSLRIAPIPAPLLGTFAQVRGSVVADYVCRRRLRYRRAKEVWERHFAPQRAAAMKRKRAVVKASPHRFQDIVRSHTTESENPHALLIFGSVCMSIEVPRATVPIIFENFDKKKSTFEVFRTKSQILIKPR